MTPLGRALVDSDRTYFELAATTVALEGATLVWMPGIEAVPGSSVVQRVRDEAIASEPHDWVERVTGQARAVGCRTARIYLLRSPSPLDEALAGAGFERRTEIGYLARGAMTGGEPGAHVSLRPVDSPETWEVKRKLHARSEVAADGHRTEPDDWVELERRKCATGEMLAFLIEADGVACGSVATIECPALLRAKNIFVHPDHRREGIAAQAMRLLSRRAVALGKEATGIFGVAGKPGNAVYRHLGMTPGVRQYEWSRPLSPAPRP